MIVESLKAAILNYYILGCYDTSSNNSSSELLTKIKTLLKTNKTKNLKLADNNIVKPTIPNNWEWVQLNEVCYVITDGEHSTPRRIKSNEGYYLLSARNILDNFIKLDDVDYVDKKEFERISRRCNPKKGDILISCSGSIGRCAVIMDDNNYVMVRSAAMIRPCLINPKFVMYAIQSPFVKKQIDELKKQTVQANLFLGAIASIYVPIPSLEEQQMIVHKIEELFAKLDEIKPIEDELEMMKSTFSDNMRKSILNDSFSGTANFINEDYENWKSDLIINIADIYTGNSIPESVKKNKYANTEIGYNYIATKDLLFNHTFNYNNGIKIPYSEKGFKYASKNDILMCIEGGSAGKKIGILDEKVCYGNKLCKFSIKTDSVIPKFLYYYLQSNVFLKNFYENLNGIIGGVSVNKIKKIIVKYPSISEQKLIVEKIEQLLSICDDIDNIVRN